MEKSTNSYGFNSIRNRILIFSILITLIPSIGMGWFLYNIMQTTITEKIEQKLVDSSSIIEREISLWFKERSHDLHVFSNSFVIAENFSQSLNAKNVTEQKSPDATLATKKIVTYLTSVQKHFDDYVRLFVMDNDGTVVAVSETEGIDRPVQLPKDLAKQIASTKHFTGEVYFEEGTKSPLMVIGIPLFSKQFDKHIGLLAIEARLECLLPLLKSALANSNNDVQITGSLVNLMNGRRFLSTDTSANSVTLPEDTLKLFNNPTHLQNFVDFQKIRVAAIVTPLQQLPWGLIIKVNHDDVFASAVQSRNRNILIVCSFALLIGFAAYLFAKQIITPLTTLTNGAKQVADGDLDVHLPIQQNDELGFATRIFNEMVAELRQNHAKLEQLATTDNLTKLANRKLIMDSLVKQFEYFQRYGKEFSIMMIDIDHFKKINDTYGHLAGDAVLLQISRIFVETLRNVDTAGRYGGEEFLIVLAETEGGQAQQTAERIRKAVLQHKFVFENRSMRISVSIGVTGIQPGDANEDTLINRADQAMYQAKKNGRNQVVYVAGDSPTRPKDGKIISLSRSA
jgi:diguanylate cyclase (GGDEF)-like protein